MGFWRDLFRLPPQPPCQVCEEFKSLLSIEKHEKKILLDAILNFHRPVVTSTEEPLKNQQPIKPSIISWRMRQEMAEAEDRRTAQILREQKEEEERLKSQVQELEKDVLGVTNG